MKKESLNKIKKYLLKSNRILNQACYVEICKILSNHNIKDKIVIGNESLLNPNRKDYCQNMNLPTITHKDFDIFIKTILEPVQNPIETDTKVSTTEIEKDCLLSDLIDQLCEHIYSVKGKDEYDSIKNTITILKNYNKFVQEVEKKAADLNNIDNFLKTIVGKVVLVKTPTFFKNCHDFVYEFVTITDDFRNSDNGDIFAVCNYFNGCKCVIKVIECDKPVEFNNPYIFVNYEYLSEDGTNVLTTVLKCKFNGCTTKYKNNTYIKLEIQEANSAGITFPFNVYWVDVDDCDIIRVEKYC